MIHKYGIPVLAAVALAFAILYMVNSQAAAPPHSPYQPPAEKPGITSLAGSGIVEPLNQNMAIGSPLAGIVTSVISQTRVGRLVQKGEVLFTLDDRAQQEEIRVRQADVFAAEMELKRLKMQPRPEEIPPKEARVKELTQNLQDKQKAFDITDRAYRRKSESLDNWQKARYAVNIATAQLRQAEADLALTLRGAWEADLAVKEAALEQAKAKLEQAKVDLKRLTVTAPITSTLLEVKVRVGEFVGAQPGLNLITLANTQEIIVRVDIDEHDAPRFDKSNPPTAKGYIRGQTDHYFPLVFDRVEPNIVPKKSLTGDNTERVDSRVLQVLYRLKNKPDGKHQVYIGQQMDVFFNKPGS